MTEHDLRRHQGALLLALALAGVAPGAWAQTPPGALPGQPLSFAPAGAAGPPGAPSSEASARQALTTRDEARDEVPLSVELRRRAKRAWDERRYPDALRDYEEAAALAPDPRLFFNLADTCEKLGRYPDALRWLTRFHAEASRDELDQVPHLGKRLALLRNRVAVLKVSANVPGARVLVRDAVVGTQPPGRPLEVAVNAGQAMVEIVRDGYRPYYKAHTLQGGQSLELAVELSRDAAPVTVIDKTTTVYVRSTPFWSQWWFWAGASVLLAGGAATVYALSTEKAPRAQSDQTVLPTALPSSLGLRF
ncbi:MAG TPA: tetratricopeptide repeat protein [Polyangiaceae bacterium]|nr:tetratricopeptide repeat protein [Polyangiaceae bacterium]